MAGFILLAKAPGFGFPMSFNDPMFVGMSDSGEIILTNNQTTSNKSFQNNTSSAECICLGNNTVTLCRIFSRDGIRIGGEGGPNFFYDRCWFESYGIDDDHADAFQVFAPGNDGFITITNTTFKAWRDADVPPPGNVGSEGIFYADDYGGDVNMTNVLFWGGRVGCDIRADPGRTVNIRFNNVYFVGPFTTKFIIDEFGGTLNVVEWNDVYDATIVDGVLIPGAPIGPPTP